MGNKTGCNYRHQPTVSNEFSKSSNNNGNDVEEEVHKEQKEQNEEEAKDLNVNRCSSSDDVMGEAPIQDIRNSLHATQKVDQSNALNRQFFKYST